MENIQFCPQCVMEHQFDGSMCTSCGYMGGWMSFTFSNGVQIVNVTAHECTFEDSVRGVVNIPPSGVVVDARLVKVEAGAKFAATLESAVPQIDADSLSLLSQLEERFPKAIIIGSMLAAQAYPGRVHGMVAVDGYERVPASEKRMRSDKFTVYETFLDGTYFSKMERYLEDGAWGMVAQLLEELFRKQRGGKISEKAIAALREEMPSLITKFH